MAGPTVDPGRIDEYWDWLAVALFLLVTLDMLTTVFAAAELGTAAEANPLMRWALDRGMGTLVALNLAVVGLAVGFFWALVRTFRQAPPRYRRALGLLIEAWLGLLVFVGLLVLANNLAAVVLGRSLL